MGYASYLEDILLRLDKFESIIDEHNKTSNKKIDINDYLQTRSEILNFIRKLHPYLEQDADVIDYNKLKVLNQSLQKEIKAIKKQNVQLGNQLNALKNATKKSNSQHQSDIIKLKGEITSIKKMTENLIREKENLINDKNNLTISLNTSMRNLHECKKNQRSISDSILDTNTIFQELYKIIKSNSWYKDNDKRKQIEFLVQKGQ